MFLYLTPSAKFWVAWGYLLYLIISCIPYKIEQSDFYLVRVKEKVKSDDYICRPFLDTLHMQDTNCSNS